MSFHFYRVDKLANEEQLLRKKLEIENQIREQREKKRLSRAVEGKRYSRILEPVTKSLEELKANQKPDPPTEKLKPVTESPEKHIQKPVVENLIDLDDDGVTPKFEDFDENPGDLFQDALRVYH